MKVGKTRSEEITYEFEQENGGTLVIRNTRAALKRVLKRLSPTIDPMTRRRFSKDGQNLQRALENAGKKG